MANYLSKVIIDNTEALIKDSEARNSISSLSGSVSTQLAALKKEYETELAKLKSESSAELAKLKSESATELEKVKKLSKRMAKKGYSEALNSIKVIQLPHSKTTPSIIDLSYNYSIDISRTIYALTVVVNGTLPGGNGSESPIMTTFVFPGSQLIEETGFNGTNKGFNIVNHYATDYDGYISLGIVKTKSGNEYWQSFYRTRVFKENTEVTNTSTVYATAYTFQTNLLPYYFYQNSYLSKRLTTLQNLDNSISGHGDSFIFLTDPHIENNSNYSPTLVSYIINHTDTNKIILGGDYCNEPFSRTATFNQISENVEKYKYLADEVYFVRGNHDSGQYGNDNQLSPIYISSLLMDHLNNTIWLKTVLYYYRDNTSAKIRYFILDSGNNGSLDEDQVNWLKQKSHELGSDWTIVCFVHQGIGDDTEGDTKNVYLYTSGTQIVNALAGCAAHVACVVCGHMHIDLSYSVGNYYFIATTCDNPQRIFSKHDRAVGTIKENAFDVFHINTSTKTVSVTRIGGGAGDPTSNPAVNDRVFSYK